MAEELTGGYLEGPNKGPLAQLFQQLETGESRYKNLIAEQKKFFGGAQESFAEDLAMRFGRIGRDEAEHSYFRDRLRGNILVDLGGGRLCRMLSVAGMYDSSAYINVDSYIAGGFGDLPYDPTKNQYKAFYEHRSGLPGWVQPQHFPHTEPAIVNADMLDFVSRLPDNSVNFTMNGIDYDILGEGALNIKYQWFLAGEIIRTLRPGGIIFGVNFSPIVDQFTGCKEPLTAESQRSGLREHRVPGEGYTSLGARWNSLLVYEKQAQG
ncbi:hypothetical protein A3A40_00380 [Candidatus Kaiserbacteria bacterium RIFCSPLOWO2_01_FULL_54_20]|uniref:Methyltransferase type 11 domain-containing protein n=1 Tax=Candidatus Kaiserbacteria bacterium RIFCSPLOWO2_01_FULL_54_20 TaxID=1798513 RepID=A0A1F6EKL2_9BACT|nr:MAG: hypothetical protein A3A40_00380 [Candidatus Kaiserbacteria bacterium RIFCSPLOWO2_01_FULL_54_20]